MASTTTWMVLHRTEMLGLQQSKQASSTTAIGWSSDEPMQKGSTTRSSPLGSGLIVSSCHCHFGGDFWLLLLGLICFHTSWQAQNLQFKKPKKDGWQLAWVVYSSQLMQYLFASNSEGAE